VASAGIFGDKDQAIPLPNIHQFKAGVLFNDRFYKRKEVPVAYIKNNILLS
jgi:hypothetical protein